MGMNYSRMPRIKKILAAFLVTIMVFALAGCIRYRSTFTVNPDGTVDVKILYAIMSNTGLNGLTGDDDSSSSAKVNKDEEKMDALKELGWNVEDYDSDDYTGMVVSKNGIKLADLQDELRATDLGFDDFSLKEKDGLYTITWDTTKNSKRVSESVSDVSSLSTYGAYMEFELNLPNKPENTNATKTDGNKFTWDMLKNKEDIFAEFKLEGSGFPAWAIGLIVGGVLIAGGVVAAIVIMNSKKKGGAQPAPVAYDPSAQTAPAFQPQAYQPQAYQPQAFQPQAPVAPQAPVQPQAFQPQTPVAPQAPVQPQAFQPQTPIAPQAPVQPQAFQPQTPVAPQAPVQPQAFQPQTPVAPQAPVQPQAFQPQTPVAPQAPVQPQAFQPQAPVAPQAPESPIPGFNPNDPTQPQG